MEMHRGYYPSAHHYYKQITQNANILYKHIASHEMTRYSQFCVEISDFYVRIFLKLVKIKNIFIILSKNGLLKFSCRNTACLFEL